MKIFKLVLTMKRKLVRDNLNLANVMNVMVMVIALMNAQIERKRKVLSHGKIANLMMTLKKMIVMVIIIIFMLLLLRYVLMNLMTNLIMMLMKV